MSYLSGRTPRDANRAPALFAVDTTTGLATVPLEANPATGALLVETTTSGSSSFNLTQVGGANISLGQTTKSASLPVTVASDQGALTVSGTVTTTPPSNASTNITQVGGSAIALGNTTMSASIPVTLASNDTNTVPFVTAGGGGYVRQDSTATIAKESGGNLATIVTNQTNATQQTKITNGTNIADVVAGDTGFNGVVVNSGTKTYSFTTSSSGAQTILANTPCSGYSWIEVVYTSVGSGLALTGQYSMTSGGTYVNSSSFSSAATSTATSSLGVAVSTLYVGPTRGAFFQIAVSALTSGTFSGTVTFMTFAPPLPAVSAAQSGTWSVGASSATGSAIPSNAFFIGARDTNGNLFGANLNRNAYNSGGADSLMATMTAQFDDVSPTSITENQFGNVRISNNRNLYTTLRDAAGNERGANVDVSNNLMVNVAGGIAPTATVLNTYSIHLTTNTTTTPTSSTAYISSISISNEVGGTTSTVTIQDKQGTSLKLVNGLATTALTTAPTVINFQTPVKMVSGIDIITAGAVAATIDVWINYYQ